MMNKSRNFFNFTVGKTFLALCIVVVLILVGLIVYGLLNKNQQTLDQAKTEVETAIESSNENLNEQTIEEMQKEKERQELLEKQEGVQEFNKQLDGKEIELEEIKVSDFEAVLNNSNVFIKGKVENTTEKEMANVELNVTLENSGGNKILDYSIVFPKLEPKETKNTSTNVGVDLKEIKNIKAEIKNFVKEDNEKGGDE